MVRPNHSTRARQKQAFVLRMAGLTFTEIAAYRGEDGKPLYAHSAGAHAAVRAYMRENGHGDVLKEQRALDMERFDALQRAMWRKALGGDLSAAKFVLSVMRERQKLLGLQGLVAQESVEDPLDELAARRNKKTGTDG